MSTKQRQPQGPRILVIGGVAGGASAAARARRLSEDAEIIMFERGPHVSFSNCGLPYHLSGTIEDSDDLLMMEPGEFRANYNIDVRTRHEVTAIDREAKTITVRDLDDDHEYEEVYDYLVLSPGASPIKPPLDGIDKPHVHTVRNVVDIVGLKEAADAEGVERVAVVGGGFIGIEIAENLKMAGHDVVLVEAMDQVLTIFDEDMVQILHKELFDHGISLILGDAIDAVGDDDITLASGRKEKADLVVMAIGVRPETKLAQDAGLEIGETRAIKVNADYQTSDPSIYAVGDAIEVFHMLNRQPTRLALAGPAQRQARAAVNHMFGCSERRLGVIGSSCLRVFDYNAACTGLTEKQAEKNGFCYDSVYVIPFDKVSIMPDAEPLHLKVVFERPTGRVLGAQAIGKGDATKRIDVIAAMIQQGATLEDLRDLELCYSPVFSTAKDAVNMAGLVGLNILHGVFRQVPMAKARELVEEGATIIDVRGKPAYERSHIKGAINIPIAQFRQRLDEIPKDRPVYLHCRSGQTSYFVTMALQNMGYDNIYNIAGSFMGLSFHEYFKDQQEDRESILTGYNFA